MLVSLMGWKNRRYLKLASLLSVLAIAIYVSQTGGTGQPPNGGTWQGYVLGTAGALMILWLAALGIRKRRYSSAFGSVQGWTSAHVYLGTALLLVATLHCAAQFGWNVHTLAYVLMTLVIVSGFYGLYVYMHLPGRMTTNRGDKNRELWQAELEELDDRIRSVSQGCDAELQALALSALELTQLGGSPLQQLTARDRSRVVSPDGGKFIKNTNQQIIIDALVTRIPNARRKSEAEVLNQLLALFGRRQVILHVLRKDVQLRGLVKIWLYFHIPLTVALIMALGIHIFSVLVYW